MSLNNFDDNITVVVFGGAHYGNDPKYSKVANELGKFIAEAGFELVTGAGMGMMEEVSKGAKEAGGKVFGVGLQGQPPNQYIDKYHERVGIHSRQSYLFSAGDAFIALPGGLGTLYEISEIAVLKKLSEVEQEPVILLNFEGFYDDAKAQLEKMRIDGFIGYSISRYMDFVDTPSQAVETIKSFYTDTDKE